MTTTTARTANARPRYGLDTVASTYADTAGGDSGIAAQIRALLPQLDLQREHVVYIRKSNPRAESERSNYLRYQERLAALVAEAGVPEHLISVLDEDVGISGIYDATYRPSLRAMEARLVDESLGTVWVVDLARISRDPSYVAPTILAQRLSNAGVKIVHFEHDVPALLDLGTETGRDQFLARCQHAAKQRLRLRSQTLKARQEAFVAGEWSGSPLPIGWVLDPPRREVVNGRHVEVAARVQVYEPHAWVKRRIMELGAGPEIGGWADLLRAVGHEGLVIEPFPTELREYMSTRSCLKNAVRKGEVYNPDQPVRITKHMLYNLLLEPLAMGYRLYGSGARAGAKEWQQIEKKYAKMSLGAALPGLARPDSLVRDYRVFGGIDPALALFDIESVEAQELFWGLQEKWSEFDVSELRRSNFEVAVPKGERRRGRPVGSGTANHWVGRIVCGLHDDDEHLLSYNPGVRAGRTPTPRWSCWRDRRMDGDEADWCITVGGEDGVDLLTRTLDGHLLYRLQAVLEGARAAAGNQPEDNRARQVEALQREIEGHQRRLSRQRRDLNAAVERWEDDGWHDNEIEVEQKRWIVEQIVPLERALRDARKRLAELLDVQSPAARTALPAGEMLAVVGQIRQDWSSYPVAAKKALIDTLVERVTVIADRGPVQDEVWIRVDWKPGITDLLLAWRNPALDKRPFTADEDDALRMLWASPATWNEITATLQPGRRYNLVRRRAAELKIKDANRSRAWREAANQASQSYGQRHPDVLYWALMDGAWAEARTDGGRAPHESLPAGVTAPEAVQAWLQVAHKGEATNTHGRRPGRPP